MIETTYSKSIERPATQVRSAAGLKYAYLLLATIVFLGLGMRFFKLGDWSFWIDEIYTVQALLDPGPFTLRTPISIRLAAAIVAAFGVNEWTARLGPALIGVISLPILFFPIRKIFGNVEALLAILILAISPWHLYWSQNARFYTALMLFYTLGAFSFFFWMEKNRLHFLGLTFIFLLLAINERQTAFFIIPVIGVYFLALWLLPFGKPEGLRRRNLMLLLIPGVAYGIYQGIRMLDVVQTRFISWPSNPLRVLLSMVAEVGVPLFLIGLLGGVYLLSQRSRAGMFIFLGAVVPFISLVVISPFTLAVSRYAFVALPCWAILGAVAAKEIYLQATKHGRILAVGIILVLLLDAAGQDMLYYTFQNGNRPDWRGAFEIVRQGKVIGDLVVTSRPPLGDYYLGESVGWALEMSPEEIVQGGQRVWFVVDDQSGFPKESLSWLETHSQLVDVRDVYVPGKLMSLRVFLYDPARLPR